MKSEPPESEALRRSEKKLKALTDQVEENTRILKQSQLRELQLLQAEDLASLFREMTAGLAHSYRLQTVTVVLSDPDHDIRHLLLASGKRPRDLDALQLVESLTGRAPQYIALPRPWLGPYRASDHQLLFPASGTLKSIAMIPLMFRGKLLGSINFGSEDASRFTRQHATDFFAHLGVISSFALENAINRARLLRSGFTDVLTGWHNRRYLQVRMNEELARAKRENSELTCLMIDIDHFKSINDSHGHSAGDLVLREIAQRIESEVRVSDVSARFGGEEFVVLLPATNASAGASLAERIRNAVRASRYDLGNGKTAQITASIGVSSVAPAHDDDDLKTIGESLIARADVALYDAKAAGRNQVRGERQKRSA
jgi:two-component system cell cycle response regulator